jgi:CheY-like chemotaxis protein
MLLKNIQLFIVEDNPQNRVIFQMSLIRHGASVQFERRGDGALYQLKNLTYVDGIILDLMLADGLSGFDIFDQIRMLPKFARVPIVAVSAMDPHVAIPTAQAKGFAGFIAKPIDDDLFSNQIAAILHGTPVWYAGERAIG